ncbi:MAG: type II toxin-antitoxin system death-on-curing family toxin, partial [Anaerolineales bacterium]
IDETGGGHGVRDLGLLEAAVMRPQATFGGEELYPEVFLKAAALLHSLIRNHPFVDGNKRTGITAAGLFLMQNGHQLAASNPELEAFALSVATSGLEIEALATWLEENSQPIR